MRVYMDNFYTGVPLFREFAVLGDGGCGTVRANRKFLSSELPPKRLRGTVNRKSGRHLSDYQSYMMGVDLTNQMIGYYMQNHNPAQGISTTHSTHSVTACTRSATSVRQTACVGRPPPAGAECMKSQFIRSAWKTTTSRCRVCEVPGRPKPAGAECVKCLEDHHQQVQKVRGRPPPACAECVKSQFTRGAWKTTTSMCRVCEVPIHKKCLEDHHQQVQSV
ncbi:hypothetical protein RRG08_049942 [Elysia crispata]|uniref:PiggyBac transposable element-derived protein domain-containing protein n=1 Tax=Elysia crispata TaxID=231223 RepID=A0AAE1E4I0_9GAST|nr:hypothetical protein RRG08_049942 [Elysia crispata]